MTAAVEHRDHLDPIVIDLVEDVIGKPSDLGTPYPPINDGGYPRHLPDPNQDLADMGSELGPEPTPRLIPVGRGIELGLGLGDQDDR